MALHVVSLSVLVAATSAVATMDRPGPVEQLIVDANVAVEQRDRASPLPERLVVLGRTPPDVVLPSLDIALRSTDYEGLQRDLEQISDPQSPRYGEWLSEEQVTRRVAAQPEAIDAVRAWVASAGIAPPELTHHKDWLILWNVSAASVERLLGAPLYQHRDTRTGLVVTRLRGGYFIPATTAPHVLNIQPIHSVPPAPFAPRRHLTTAYTGSQNDENASWPHDCKGLTKAGMITPAVVRERYNFSLPSATSSAKGSIAALLPGPIGVLDSEVAYIQQDCGISAHKIARFVGKNHAKECARTGKKLNDDMCAEAAIDSQIQATNAVGIRQEFWAEDCGGFTCMFRAINDAAEAAPRVFSFSFGEVSPKRMSFSCSRMTSTRDACSGSDTDTHYIMSLRKVACCRCGAQLVQFVAHDVMHSAGDPETERDDDVLITDREFAKATSKGITLIASSGDDGGGYHPKKRKLITNYPPSSPYILSVGGTSFVTPSKIGAERAVVGSYSSGGFSSVFTEPAWQRGLPTTYLENSKITGLSLPPSGSYNPKGRGVPDVSALSGGDGIDCWQIRYAHTDDGEPNDWGCMGGTSTSGPFIASLVARLNAARLAVRKPTMGFINPWLYAVANTTVGLYDVLTGDNCDTDPPNAYMYSVTKADVEDSNWRSQCNSTYGWLASAGWDPVTGLGTPNYKLLEALALE